MKISVIVPVYNAERYIGKCISSVLAQTYKNWELIAIDDGSTDSSYNIIKKYAGSDRRILVETKENEGPGLTRNRALDKATGDYVVFLDADDYIEPEYFALLRDKAEKERADVVFIDVIQEAPDGTLIKFEKMSNFRNLSREAMIGCQMTGYMPWGGCRKAASRALIESRHLRYTSDIVGEEAIFSFELLRNARRVCFIEEALYHYINHPRSQSKNPEGTWAVTLKKMTDHLEENGIREEYCKCLNAFAFVILILWVLKNAKSESVFMCRKNFKKKICDFERQYGWDMNPKYLRKELRFLLPIVKNRVLFPVVVAARGVNK